MKPPQGCRVLIVEDNALVSEMMVDAVNEWGCEPIGPFHTVDETAEYIAGGGQADVAILDINLDRKSYEIAEVLLDLQIPFIFVTGETGDIPVRFAHALLVHKPFTVASLRIAVRTALGTTTQ